MPLLLHIFYGSDSSQVYELQRHITHLQQAGGPLEKFYTKLQGIWRKIDFRRPNAMKCSPDIQQYNQLVQEDRAYTFLDRLDDRLDNIRSDVLQMQPFLSVEQAYAHVRREALPQAVMTIGDLGPVSSAVLASKCLTLGPANSSSIGSSSGSRKNHATSKSRAATNTM
ncbi:hypothetical protein MRB53_023987 [Persea americana]|uniref:Uncharacterized protein n=1 Tax=Persea americana TaxID=3435 RepID=A0ACC2LB44_PERAE|nr:hypothetical protein MRB53_023987 [Persea americana]